MTSGVKPDIKIAELVEDMTYIPSPEQRKTKAAFYAVYSDNPLCERADISATYVQQVTGDSRVRRWWSDGQFRQWFINGDEFRQRVEYLAHLALDTLEKLLGDDNPKTAGARVNAAKLLVEVANKLPQRWKQEKWHDAEIGKMDKKQLEDFLRRQGVQLMIAAGEVGSGGVGHTGLGEESSNDLEARTAEHNEEVGEDVRSDIPLDTPDFGE